MVALNRPRDPEHWGEHWGALRASGVPLTKFSVG